MIDQPSSNLIQSVRDELLAESPCIDTLREELRAEYHASDATLDALLHGIVRELNAQLFPPIRKMELMLTASCNLRCSYCFEQRIHGTGVMSKEVARAAVDLLIAYCDGREDIYISLFGGEPTLNFSVLRDVTEYAEKAARDAKKNVHFNMTSNGVDWSDEKIDFFSLHNIKVLFSLDGLQSSHDRFRVDRKGAGTFTRVMGSIVRLKEKMPWVGIKMTISKENLSSLFKEVVELYHLGVNQFIIGPATGMKWSEKDTKLYLGQINQLRSWYLEKKRVDLRITDFEEEPIQESYFGCQAGRDNISVDMDGIITGCSKIRSLESDCIVGKLGDVRYGITSVKRRMDYITCEKLKDNCGKLGIQPFFGGCFASNYEQTNDIFSPNLYEHDFSLRIRSF